MLHFQESSAPPEGGAEAGIVDPPRSSPMGLAQTGRSDRALGNWLDQRFPAALPGEPSQFVTLFVVLRWATLSLAIVLGLVAGHGKSTLIAGGVLAACNLVVTVRPPRYQRGGWRISARLLGEVALVVMVVEATGFGNSPFLITLGVATTAAGFAGGLRLTSGLAVIAGLSVVVPTVLHLPSQATTASVELALLIVLVGGVGGYCRYLVEDARQVGPGLATNVEHLSKMNDRLLDLHSAARQVATPFDLDGTAKWACERLEAQFAADVAAVLLRDPTTGCWHVAEARGLRLTGDRQLSLPATLSLAASGNEPVFVADLRDGLGDRSRWGLYSPLRAGDELLGLLAVECNTSRPTASSDRRCMGDLASATALAVGNARWLQRLHVLTVEQERSRLARDLHDRISQSVVYLGFEVDRLADLNLGRAVRHDLLALRGGLRTVVGELRDTLVDLRSDVSDETDVAALLRSFVDRVNRRGNIAVMLSTECDRRLPVGVERELWHIAKEAVTNAERHSRSSHMSILWTCDQHGALLEVADDGVGFADAEDDAADATSGYGLLGMRERADAIRAQLDIISDPLRGTVIRARWAFT
jgi:signal transduction histidine kinase